VKHRFAVRAGAFLFVFILVTAGRWVASAGAGYSALSALLTSSAFGLIAGGIAAFAADLVLVRSLLQRKILFIRILLLLLVVLAVCHGLFGFPRLLAGLSLFVSALLLALLFAFDARRAGGPDILVAGGDHLPGRYLRRRPLKSAAGILLRLFPDPEPVGLYRIGSPGIDSPVVVTGNFELTVRRVARTLGSPAHPYDCWLLVCDSRGVNVWCASMAGHFTTDSVVRAIELTNLAGKVRGRQLILPQLCASSVSPEELESRTGFSARFGPVSIHGLRAYRRDPKDPQLRAARFPLPARVEMALGCPFLLSLLLILLYNFIGLGHLAVLLPALYLVSVVQGLIFPRRPVRRIGLWAVVYGGAAFLAAGLVARVLFPGQLLLYALTLGIGAAYLVTEFSGWSPLIKYSLIPHGRPRVEVERRSCIGCRRCVEVCPRGVFRMTGGRSSVISEDRCVICRSCFSRCPTGAVRHSHGFSPPVP
jgi:NAD-dependent dihydropyrimidine dehydrogenase PreA subunit